VAGLSRARAEASLLTKELNEALAEARGLKADRDEAVAAVTILTKERNDALELVSQLKEERRRSQETSGESMRARAIDRVRQKALQRPRMLRDAGFHESWSRIDALLDQAARQARGGEVNGKSLEDLLDTCDEMRRRLDRLVASCSPDDFIMAARLLRELRESIKGVISDDFR
jgi:hypothetical protein